MRRLLTGNCMNVLLLSMPDSFEHMPPVAIRMPNGALASLAGNVDPHHRVAIADLILVQGQVGPTIARLMQELQPDVVGLSVMTFQRATAHEDRAADAAAAAGRRASSPAATIRASRRTPTSRATAIDFLVRGEGEHHVPRAAARARIRRRRRRADRRPVVPDAAAGSSTTRIAPVARSKSADLALPNRGARVLGGYTLLGRQVDVVETSRGCTYDCSFCSIIEMRGRNFHPYPIERVLADIADARRHGARAIFLVDDNITLDVRRFEALCQAIIDSGLRRHRLRRAGDDVAARRARRAARAADAARRLPLRLPRHREHPRVATSRS